MIKTLTKMKDWKQTGRWPLLAMAALLLTACSDSDELMEPGNTGRSISFATDVSQVWAGGETRGTAINNDNKATAMGNFSSFCYEADGTLLYRNVGADPEGTLAEAQVWPEGKQLKFFAVHPYDANDANFGGSASTGITCNFTVNTKVAKQSDLMYAVTEPLSDDGSHTAPLSFKHALTAITFKVGAGAFPNFPQGGGAKIKSIKLKNVCTSGTYTLPTGKTSPPINNNDIENVGTWSIPANSPRADFAFVPGTDAIVSTEYTINGGDQTLLMIPQPLDGITVEIEVLTLFHYTVTYSSPIYHDAVPVWEQGKAYTYMIGSSGLLYPVLSGTHKGGDPRTATTNP